jgi:hypothetical protein
MTEAELAVQFADEAEAEAQATLAAAEQTRRDKAKAAYTRLKAGTATNAQVQEVVAWLLRQEIKELLP